MQRKERHRADQLTKTLEDARQCTHMCMRPMLMSQPAVVRTSYVDVDAHYNDSESHM